MEINIKPENIDKYVKEAIMECTFGKHIKEAIQKSVDELFSGYRNPVIELVKNELKIIVHEYLKKDDVRPLILAAIAKGLSPETIELIVANAAHDLQTRIKERND
jgi:hypothetical protein